MIKRELLKEVFKFDNINNRDWHFNINNNDIIVTYNKKKYFTGNIKKINIYQLAFDNCKKWAFKRGYDIESSHYKDCQLYDTKTYSPIYDALFTTCTDIEYKECEDIFKACLWILNKENNDENNDENNAILKADNEDYMQIVKDGLK